MRVSIAVPVVTLLSCSPVLVAGLDQASLREASDDSRHAAAKHVALDLVWVPNDALNGFYVAEIEVGTPPQRLRLLYDTGSADIFVHSTADEAYVESCAEFSTPVNICEPLYSNASSSTYKEVGPNDYSFEFLGLASQGSYVTDTVAIGGAAIPNQVFGSTWVGSLPVGLIGTAFESIESGQGSGKFPRYPTFQERLVSQGLTSSATQSIWLNPEGRDPDAFPNGTVLFGALDKSLYTGRLVTVPVVSEKNVTIPENPGNWNLPVSGVTKAAGHGKNLLTEPLSCVVDTGTAFFALPNASFVNLLAQFPSAVRNDSLLPDFPAFYEVPCSERDNPDNALSFTFFDPTAAAAAGPPPHQAGGGGGGDRRPPAEVTLVVPPWQVIWPSSRVATGGRADRCAIAAFAWEAYFAGSSLADVYQCVLGDNVMKSGYFVCDLGNRQASIAPAAAGRRPGGGGHGSTIVEIPPRGVPALGL